MYILQPEEIYNWDRFTIKEENIRSLDLMDRAVSAFIQEFKKLSVSQDKRVYIFCGTGNNGGDGVGIAMQLRDAYFDVTVCQCMLGKESEDLKQMKKRLAQFRDIEMIKLDKGDPFPSIGEDALIIDAIFGIGLSRKISGYWASLVDFINELNALVISVDTPSGLPSESYPEGPVVKADYTITFQTLKFSQILPENFPYTGEIKLADIGLSSHFRPEDGHRRLLTGGSVHSLLQPRKKFDHKGSLGHAGIYCGAFGMMGAAYLAGAACLRSGVGKLSLHIPSCGYDIIQSRLPEALVRISGENHLKSISDSEDYESIALGCGIGTDPDTISAVRDFLKGKVNVPLVLDADALNIIARSELIQNLPPECIITPHIKEFDRLFGEAENHAERIRLSRVKASELDCFIILKGAYSCISAPDGTQYFNTSGNPALATAGTGDVLAGLLCGILAQGYPPLNTCLLGVYLHGLAADLAVCDIDERSMIAGDIIRYISSAYIKIKS